MPTYARCPECHAALPHGAPWCSLCHADLRPPSTRVIPPAAPGASVELVAASSVVTTGGRHSRPEGDGGTGASLPPVRGRHRRPEPDAADGTDQTDPAAPSLPTTAPVLLRADVDALVADAPRDAEGRPDVEVLSEQLMARLATSEGRRRGSGVPDLDSVPGGKWGVMIGGMAAMAAVLVIVFGVLGAVFGG